MSRLPILAFTVVALLGTPTAAMAIQDSLIAQLRKLVGAHYPHVTIVDRQPANHHGKHHLVVTRATSRDSATVLFSVHLVNEGMTENERWVALIAAPWPDYALRLDRVTPDSVYLIGTSGRYRRTVMSAHQWWPTSRLYGIPGRPSSATSTPVCGDRLRVDIYGRTIAGIWMNQPIDAVKNEVGAANVSVREARAEGHPVPEYVIMLCGHEIRRRENGVRWTDPVFRTAEGLGVGSPLAAFDTLYGVGEAIGEEGNSVRYSPITGGGNVFVDVPPECYGLAGRRWTVDRTCRITAITLSVYDRP